MLSAAKPKLEKELQSILNNALQEAFKTTYEHSDSEFNIYNAVKKEIDDAAEKFAGRAAAVAAKPLANAIYDFVKSISITATPKTPVTPLSGSLAEGTTNIFDFKIS